MAPLMYGISKTPKLRGFRNFEGELDPTRPMYCGNVVGPKDSIG